MQGSGGFDHNAQSLRVVTELEKKYARFDGLNLTWETLEGLVKHNGPLTGPKAARHEAAPVPNSILAYCAKQDLELATFASIEAQAAALADDIAYNNHDIDDGYRAGLFTFAELADVPIAARALARGARRLSRHRRHAAPLRSHPPPDHRMIDDAIAETRAAARRARAHEAPTTCAMRRAAVVAFSPAMQRDLDALRAFLATRRLPPSAHRQHHGRCRERGRATCSSATATIPAALPPEWREQAPPRGTPAHARHICRLHRRHDRPLRAGRASPLV